uniref:Uncharacterized protein n=1 Tax=Pelusios castaneus TaxID=367368 RepID=A0A8C8R5Z3_9SAUR
MSTQEPPVTNLGSWGLLSFLLLAPLACQGCPVPCECSEPARTVKCVLKELSAVPAEIPGYTRNLFITGNQIARVGSQDFRGLPNLVTLSLANNSRSLYNSSANLSKLELTNNEIVYLPLGMFSSLCSLRHLDLRNNSLVDIKNATFAGLDLEHLDLTLNALKTLRIEALADLGRQMRLRLFLRDNPFVCNCDIEDLVGWLNQSEQVADVEKLACVFPRDLQNTTLLDLAGAELGCHSGHHSKDTLQTSYVFLGIVLGLICVVFLFVLYLNRKEWLF